MSIYLVTWVKWSNFLKNTSAKTYTRRKRLNRPVSIKETESIIKNLPEQQQAPDRFTGELKHLRKNLCQCCTISSRR